MKVRGTRAEGEAEVLGSQRSGRVLGSERGGRLLGSRRGRRVLGSGRGIISSEIIRMFNDKDVCVFVCVGVKDEIGSKAGENA